MAGSGMIIGGLLGGLGKGMEMTALQAREDALTEARNQRVVEAEGRSEQRVIASEGRLEGRVMRQEDRAESRDVRSDQRDYTVKTGLLAVAHKQKMLEGETEQAYKIRLKQMDVDADKALERLRQSGAITLAQYNDALDDADDARKAGELIVDYKTLPSGQVVGVTANGNTIAPKVTRNGKREALVEKPTATEMKADGEEAADIRREARRAEREGKKPPIAAAAPMKKAEGKVISDADYTALYSQAAARVQRGEDGYKGLDAAGIEAKVKGILRKNGYAI